MSAIASSSWQFTDFGRDMRVGNDMVGNLGRTLGQETSGLVTFFFLPNTLCQMLVGVDFGVKKADGFDERF
jgi:hypothetical protein